MAAAQRVYGNPMLEVFGVVIQSESPTDLYGTVIFDDGVCTQHLYKREVNDYERILPNKSLTLTGPPRTLLAVDSVSVCVDLTDKLTGERITGEILFDSNYSGMYPHYNKPLAKMFTGNKISATLNYVILSEAMAAKVVVTLLGKNKNSHGVYGSLFASSAALSESPLDTTITLFNNSMKEEHIIATKKRKKQEGPQVIELVRSIVHLPEYSNLKVTADLMIQDKEIAKGFAEFAAEIYGTVEKNIGEIKVQVTFSSS